MDDLRDKFVKRGLRCTKQRRAVYGALCSTKRHPTADELHHMVRSHHAGVSLATVYNALEAFAAAGLCKKLPTTSGSIRYDADMNEHLHFRSEPDGRIQDISPTLSDRLLSNLPVHVLREIERELGVSIDRVQIQLIGRGDERGLTE